ncbi:hypothetical protein GCM10009609_56710 [Pseudonocardia aurantiaca]|uniref:Uncharacterized protein n=1 Tax=Pseudonocardia aurantiaca TaxID=75290 RepID=A0ABW4FVP8_9PSEU
MRHGSAIGRGLAAVLAGSALVLAAPAAAAAPPPPKASLSINPTGGVVPASVTAEVDCGAGDDSGWRIDIGGGTPVSILGFDLVQPGASSGTVGFEIPADAPGGSYTIGAYCLPLSSDADLGALVDTAVFTVEQPVPDPSVLPRPGRARVGEAVVLAGDWLPGCSGDTWTAVIAGISQPAAVRSLTPMQTFASAPERYAGEFRVTVPAGAAVGPTELALACSGVVIATAPFEVAETRPTTTPTTDPTTDPTTRPTPSPVRPTGGGGSVSGGGSGPDVSSAGGGQTVPDPTPVALPAPQPQTESPSVLRVATVLPSLGSGLLALLIAILVLRAYLARSGRDWAARHVQVILRQGSVRR